MSNTVDIEVVTPVTAQAEIHKYTLVSDDIYVKRYDSFNVPDWYENMIHDIIDRNYNVNTTGDIIAFLSNLQEGYSQSLTTLKNKDEVINASLTSLITKSDVALAGIANLDITKISAADAQAISRQLVIVLVLHGLPVKLIRMLVLLKLTRLILKYLVLY